MSFKGNLKLMLLDACGNPFPGKVTLDLTHTVLDRTRHFTVNVVAALTVRWRFMKQRYC